MPEEIRKAMELQMTAERQKRARILESEGIRQAQINESEGEAEAIETIAQATARSIDKISSALSQSHGEKAAALQIAEKYISAFKELAKESNTLILPANLNNPSAMISEAMAIYDHIKPKSALQTLTTKH